MYATLYSNVIASNYPQSRRCILTVQFNNSKTRQVFLLHILQNAAIIISTLTKLQSITNNLRQIKLHSHLITFNDSEIYIYTLPNEVSTHRSRRYAPGQRRIVFIGYANLVATGAGTA